MRDLPGRICLTCVTALAVAPCRLWVPEPAAPRHRSLCGDPSPGGRALRPLPADAHGIPADPVPTQTRVRWGRVPRGFAFPTSSRTTALHLGSCVSAGTLPTRGTGDVAGSRGFPCTRHDPFLLLVQSFPCPKPALILLHHKRKSPRTGRGPGSFMAVMKERRRSVLRCTCLSRSGKSLSLASAHRSGSGSAQVTRRTERSTPEAVGTRKERP